MEDGVWLTREEAWEALRLLSQLLGDSGEVEPAYVVWRSIASKLVPDLFPDL